MRRAAPAARRPRLCPPDDQARTRADTTLRPGRLSHEPENAGLSWSSSYGPGYLVGQSTQRAMPKILGAAQQVQDRAARSG
jgi:hypothetical protein